MKKILISLAFALGVMPSMAKDYTDNLVVTLNGGPTAPQKTSIIVDENSDGTYNFSLMNFKFEGITVGDIKVDSIRGVEQDGEVYLASTKGIHVNLGGVMPMDLKVTIRAELLNNKSKLYASMDIPVPGIDVKVIFGDKYQIPNSGFEDFQDYNVSNKTVQEALSWHSFASAKGQYAPVVNTLAPHSFKSSFVRPASSGKASLMLASSSLFGIVANGTATTGRMNCGDINATNPKNHAELEINDSVDAHGDPYYVELNGQPDSLVLWYAFKQGTPNAAHPYATVNAIITDGTYYQDPEDKAYQNKRSQAQNKTIPTTFTSGAPVWKKLEIPFNIIDNSVKGKAILVTISTNADPGQGSVDTLYVDDISLVYNEPQNVSIDFGGNLNAATVTPDDIKVTWDGALGARVVKDLRQDGDSVVATVTVFNGNLTKEIKKATHTYTNVSSGINGATVSKSTLDGAKVYDINGRQVDSMRHGTVYVVKTANGKNLKIAK